MAKGDCIPCNTSRCLSCRQIITTATFESTQTKEKFNIYHNIYRESNYAAYSLECLLCKMQYVGKFETPCNVTIQCNNYSLNRQNLLFFRFNLLKSIIYLLPKLKFDINKKRDLSLHRKVIKRMVNNNSQF